MPAVPAYTSSQQAVFWASSNNLAEQSVVLNGAFSSSPKTVRIASLFGATSASTAVAASTITVSGTSMGNTGLTFTLPGTFPPGPLAYRVEDSSGLLLVGSANLPTIFWAEGIASAITAATAPLHQVLANAVELGGILRVFGRDFQGKSYVAITMAGVTKIYSVTTQNSYALGLTIPTTQATGTGTFRIGASSTIDATYGPPMPITINPASTLTATTIVCPGLVGNGTTDNTSALQACITNSLPVQLGTDQYITINTSGNYLISGTITLNPHQYLVGAAGQNVTILCNATTTPGTWITGSSFFGLVNLDVQAPVNSTGSASIFSTDSTNGGHVVLFDVGITSTNGGSTSSELRLAGPDIQVVNTTITGPNMVVTGGTGTAIAILFANGAYFSGDQLNLGSLAWNYINDSQNVIFENNDIEGLTTGTADSASGMSVIQGNYGQSISENLWFANNIIHNIQGNNCEAFTLDGGGCEYEGLLSSSTASSMVLSNAPNWVTSSGYTHTPSDCIICVLAGTGQGQYRFISSYNSATNTVQITQPWDIVPDTASVVTITGRQRHLMICGNAVTNAGPMQLYAAGQDCVIANNHLETTSGILLNSLLYSGYQVIDNTEVVDNQMHGNFMTSTNQITLEGFVTGLISGTLVRGNVGPSTGFLTFSQGGATSREFSVLEEGESAPSSGNWTEQNLDHAVLCKENTLVTARPALGALLSTPAGLYGVEFTVGSCPITVTQLGRWVYTGAASHTVGLYTTAGVLLTGGSVTVPSAGTKGHFAYANLTTPITLAANTSYFLESAETSAEKWYDATTVVCPGNGLSINGAVFNNAVTGSVNNSYGPVDLVFTPEMPLVQNISTFGPSRNNSTLSYGLNFTVGSMPMTVNKLGRWVISGNSATHTLQLYNAATNVAIGGPVTVVTSGATAGQFAYGTLSTPVTLSANTAYYLNSSETSGGDLFYDVNGTQVNGGVGSVINGGESSTHQAGGASSSYVPVNLLSTY